MDGRYKSMPASDETERMILGSILLDNDLMRSAAERLVPEDFYSPLNRRVFAAMLSLFTAQKPIEPHLVGDELLKEGSIEAIGGVPAITNLSFGLPFTSDITEHVEVVKRHAYKREMVRLCTRLINLAEGAGHDELFSTAQNEVNDLCTRVESGKSDGFFVSIDKIVDNEVMQALADLKDGRSQKIKTGFAAIDNTIGGVATSDVLLVAADTGKGKSAFALQLAYQFAAQGVPAAFLAGEMTNKENVMRLVSQLGSIVNLNWATYLQDRDYQAAVAWAQHIKSFPIYFEHRISDMQTLATHLRSLVQRRKIRVLVIDYIQLFKMERMDRRKRNERIAECSQEVKRLANELDIAVIEVAQFNREGAKSLQAGLHDLEGSGQLEKDASLIFILELSDGELIDPADGRKYSEAKIRVVKGRNVGKSEIYGKFYGMSVQFKFD